MSPTTDRVPLTRDRILAEAVTLADELGIEGLTMRALAERLGVEAMSLYYHVKNKDAMLDGMIDTVLADIDLPSPDEPWKPAQRRRAESTRAMMSRHPWAAQLMETRLNPGPTTLAYYEAVLANLRTNGFSVAMAAHAFSAIDAYVYGFGLQEMSLPFSDETDIAEPAKAVMSMMPADAYPYLMEMIIDHALQPGYDYGAEFTWGLDLVLDGLEQRIDDD
jgi:AcrR family transcriptional regulator